MLAKPVEPVMQRYSVSDCTTEALLPILAENPYGVCLIRDELAAFFNGLDAYRGGGKVDIQAFIEIHGGRFVQTDRKTGTRHLAAKTPSVSIVGGIQSDVIRQIFKNEPEFLTTGFGARFLMIYPPAETILWNHNVADPAALSSYDGLIKELLRCREYFTPDNPGIITLTPEAVSLIFDFQNRHACESLTISNGNVRYVENKAGIHAARITLALHVVKCIESGIDPVSLVTPEAMEQAITLTEWFLNEAHRIYAMLAGNEEPVDKVKQVILSITRKCGGEATIRDFRNHCGKFHKKGGTELLQGKLKEMVEAGILVVTPVEKAGSRKKSNISAEFFLA